MVHILNKPNIRRLSAYPTGDIEHRALLLAVQYTIESAAQIVQAPLHLFHCSVHIVEACLHLLLDDDALCRRDGL